jgi:hypothetical protein
VACGKPIGAFHHATCAALAIKKTFMVQFCCGSGDCTAAGASPAGKIRGIDRRGASLGQGVYILDGNGTIIPPIQIGKPPELSQKREPSPSTPSLTKRGCTQNSWKADPGKDSYTRPADNTQLVSDNNAEGGTGGSTIQITHTREQSWSTTFGATMGIEDVLSLGLSFEQSFSESVSDSKSYTFNVPAGQSGFVGFTATMRCSTGKISN